jgi:hypothetical protein
MTFIQQLLITMLPKKWGEDMRAESLTWMMRCTCGFERSVWESGGIRWKATGNPKRFLSCPHCGERTWHTTYRKGES